jgi:hypothetical protein
MYWLPAMVLAGWSLTVHAQDKWAYEVIGSNNQPTLTFTPPVDLTYPPEGMPMPIASATETRGVVITRQEAAARLRAPKLIIMLVPAQIAERRSYSSLP